MMKKNSRHLTIKKMCLATMLCMFSMPPAFAMQQLSDDTMSDTTGEGIAILPEDFKLVFQMPNDKSTGSSYNRPLTGTGATDPSQFDTGFIRIIPVGEDYSRYVNSNENLAEKRTKADVFIYGLALSRTNDNLNQRFSNTGFTWGSDANPWVVRAGTQSNVKQFINTNNGDVSYLSIEAPLAREGVYEEDNNIKLGYWLDAFSRKWGSNNQVDEITGAPTVAADLPTDQRIRLQLVANGLSLSGSQVRLFQTQASPVAQQNQTLGMASLIRQNTHDNPASLTFNKGSNGEATNLADLNKKALRISTAAIDDGTASTPALNRSYAPIFHASEGLYLYSPNINLVFGNMYQPFIVGSEGNNIVLEVTRIPNVPDIYNKIYTDYSSEASKAATLCNVASCGSQTSMINNIKYQANTATHSSISVGSVAINNKLLEANKNDNATGIVFRGPTNTAPVNLGSVVIDGVLIQHLKFKTTGL